MRPYAYQFTDLLVHAVPISILFQVVEGDLPVRTVLEASEAFCCGTGATVTPVGSVHYKPGHDELETETVTLTFMRVPVYK